MECIKCHKSMNIRLRDIDEPDWPYELNDACADDADDNERIKYNEYAEFSDIHFDLMLSYEELIRVRDELISNRPEWMNQEEFINYENAMFLYHTTPIDSEKWWAQYYENKTNSNNVCATCR